MKVFKSQSYAILLHTNSHSLCIYCQFAVLRKWTGKKNEWGLSFHSSGKPGMNYQLKMMFHFSAIYSTTNWAYVTENTWTLMS